MSSSATPHGAITTGTIVGSAFSNKVTHYKIKNAYGTSIFYGDFVKWGDDNPNTTIQTDPFVIMQMQCDGAADQDDLGKNCAVVQTAGSTAIGRSKNAVDISTVATTNTLPLKIIDFVDGPDSAVGDAYTDVLVMFNAGHQLLNATGIG